MNTNASLPQEPSPGPGPEPARKPGQGPGGAGEPGPVTRGASGAADASGRLGQIAPELAGPDTIGLDIGGSKTHGIRIRAGKVVAEAKAGSANVQNVTVEQAQRALNELFTGLGSAPGGRVGRVVAGAGGVDTPADAQRLRELIAPHVPGARVEVIHDTRLILAAGRARTGVALIAGTGSVAWGIDAERRQARAGGWGYLLGDEGSAYWVAREAVRHSLRQFNQGRKPDALAAALLRECRLGSAEELIGLFHADTGRRYWAQRARLVFAAAAAGNEASARIIDDAAGHLAALVCQVAGQLQLGGPVVVGGGLAVHQRQLRERLVAHLGEAGLTDIRFLDREPVYGVLEFGAG